MADGVKGDTQEEAVIRVLVSDNATLRALFDKQLSETQTLRAELDATRWALEDATKEIERLQSEVRLQAEMLGRLALVVNGGDGDDD